ncbi:MAG: chorismate-binding protein [Muribaculaceae bacterium]
MMQSSTHTVSQAIQEALVHGHTFFAYRMPQSRQIVFGAQLAPASTLPVSETFVAHPFIADKATPIVEIEAQYNAEQYLEAATKAPSNSLLPITQQSTSLSQYLDMANHCIEALRKQELNKVVLSRVIVQPCEQHHWGERFLSLAADSSHAFVFVFNSPESGAWMGASPELLLSAQNHTLQTMALAATKSATDTRAWTEKEIVEQQYVEQYISHTFASLSIHFQVQPKQNRIAGNVQHICTPFTAQCADTAKHEMLLNALHPTPAIAGLPKNQAIETIVTTEQHQRRYYGGFVGPRFANGDFRHFVCLRTMQFSLNQCCIYAGGGLTAQSVALDEWHETQLKAQALLSLLNNR